MRDIYKTIENHLGTGAMLTYPKRKQGKSRNLCMLKEGKMRYKKEEATPNKLLI
jgi:hypothetical protein